MFTEFATPIDNSQARMLRVLRLSNNASWELTSNAKKDGLLD